VPLGLPGELDEWDFALYKSSSRRYGQLELAPTSGSVRSCVDLALHAYDFRERRTFHSRGAEVLIGNCIWGASVRASMKEEAARTCCLLPRFKKIIPS
jgi:hypothetical protein